MAIRQILVPTDFSDFSKEALDYAIGLARSVRAGVDLVFVEGLFTYGLTGDFLASPAAVQFFEEHRQAARTELASLQRRVERRGIRSRAFFTRGGPAQAIADVARKQKADLIVMATHGRSGFSHLLIGSVAENVIRIAPCPVLTVRTAGRKAKSRRRKTVRRRSKAGAGR